MDGSKRFGGSRVETEWKSGGNRVGRREPRAGGYLISSDDCRYLQEFEPGFNTPGTPEGGGGLQALRGTRRPYPTVDLLTYILVLFSILRANHLLLVLR